MGVLFLVFAISMAVATFVENDYGATLAQKWFYKSTWFELILILLVVNLIGQIFINKLYKKEKFTILLFHLSFILIIAGAGITRYFGFDGSIHIRQGESQSIATSVENYLQFKVINKTGDLLYSNEKVMVLTPSSVDDYSKDVNINNNNYSLKLSKYLTNAFEALIDDPQGEPIISLMQTGKMKGRQTSYLKEGEVLGINGQVIGFSKTDSLDANIFFEKDSFYIQSIHDVVAVNMMSQQSKTYEKGKPHSIKPMQVYSIGTMNFVVQKLSAKSIIKPLNHQAQQGAMPQRVLEFELNSGSKVSMLNLWVDKDGKASYNDGENIVEVQYGPKEVKLPFELRLDKFIIDRYPGSNSPSSYKSEITLIDKEQNVEMPYSIYMNHILKHRGYRFYQSSYDKDEKGTILSVNQDRLGMMVTYIGYFLLIIFIVLSIFNKKSPLRTITINAFKSPAKKIGVTILAIMLSSSISFSQEIKLVVDKKVADDFGKVLIQDQKGRTKPLHTLSNDIIRKVTKKNQFENYNSMQVFLGFYADFDNWKNISLIKVGNSDLANKLGIRGDYAAFTNVVDLQNNQYKIGSLVEEAYSKAEGKRNKLDKEVIKLDERVNVLYMIYTGEFMKIFPLKDKSSHWGAPTEAIKYAESSDDSLYLSKIMGLVFESAQKAAVSKNYTEVNQFITSIKDYQRKFANYELPSEAKVNTEVTYNKVKIYERLFPYYATIGLLLIILLVYSIASGRTLWGIGFKALNTLLVAGFALHTTGLAMRWYISGHAPMSNGYESMIFISWATLLAGFIFSKKSHFAIPATAVLSALTLLVAHFSFMDPEITNLVPVLKSYWLTLHVSVIISSYGFLGLGAVLGLIVMILYSLSNPKNNQRISTAIDELTVLNYSTLTIGLYLLTIGTFLGAIWANESWGRYWGWDPKETWSLITMIVYSIVIHSRMIKPLRSVYTFNLLSLFAFSSVLMTYFGVNYYLSGLHSYASGDPIPVPVFVYITVVALFIISIVALFKYKHIESLDKK